MLLCPRVRRHAVRALPLLALALGSVLGPATAASAMVAPAVPAALHASVGAAAAAAGDFESFDAVYELSADADGRSVLRTTETLVADFRAADGQHGIQRALPVDYDGHPVDLRVVAVTDERGAPLAYDEETDDGFLIVTIADDPVLDGRRTFVITTLQHNVTHAPDDAAIDEFTWDVNGTGWDEGFARVSAALRVDPALAERFTGDAACYRGPEGAVDPCDRLVVDPAPLVVRATAAGLGPHENLTISAAFEPGTFTPRESGFFASPAAIAAAVGAVIALGAFVIALVRRVTRWRHHPGRGIVVAEYVPPAEPTVLEAAELTGHADRGVGASLLSLAVAGRVRIVETGPKRYAVEPATPASNDTVRSLRPRPTADADAAALAALLFTEHPDPAARRDLAKPDARLTRGLQRLRSEVAKRVVAKGWRRVPERRMRIALGVIAGIGGVGSVVFGMTALDQAMGGPWPAVSAVVGVGSAIGALFAVASVRPLTERGRALRDHLEGLREYIRLAEADRLRMLQSPEGALRSDEVLQLTERLLPYAVLFGLEREWSRELAALYDERDETPDWYDAPGLFDGVAFARGVHAFSAATTASWSGSASSSGSSASGGGGFSGAGGGGGGGGRV